VGGDAQGRPRPVEYVHPGHLAVSGQGNPLATILGSCVAVCLHDPRLRIGGLNHFLLPHPGHEGTPSPRYALTAIELLLQRMIEHGARQHQLVAHLVGGAAVLAAFKAEENHLGRRNVDAAREILSAHRIPVVFSDVGGIRGRKLVFDPRAGTSEVRALGG